MQASNNQEFQELFIFENISLTIFFKLTTNKKIIITGGQINPPCQTLPSLSIKNPPKIQAQEISRPLKKAAEKHIKRKISIKMKVKDMNYNSSLSSIDCKNSSNNFQDPIEPSALNFVQQNNKIITPEFSELTPTQILQKKLKKNYPVLPQLQLPLNLQQFNDVEPSSELYSIFFKPKSISPRKLGQSDIYPSFFQLTATILSLISISALSAWMLIHNILNLSNLICLSIIGVALSMLMGYCLDHLSKNESSFIRQYRFMFFALEINVIFFGIASEFLISTNIATPLTILTAGLITLTLSVITGIVYDINIDRENQKNPLVMTI